jgi:hypothetical protein
MLWRGMRWEGIDMTGTIFVVSVFVLATLLSLFIDYIGEQFRVMWWIRGVIWVGSLSVMLYGILWVLGVWD